MSKAPEPTHEIDLTEGEVWQVLNGSHHPDDYLYIYLDPRPDDPDFETDFARLYNMYIRFMHRSDPIVTAYVIDHVTPAQLCEQRRCDPGDEDAPTQYRIELLTTKGFVLHEPVNTGAHASRLRHAFCSRVELSLARLWEIENDRERMHNVNCGQGILQDLLLKHLQPMYLTNRERRVAATAIQWLGSNCGLAFLGRVNQASGGQLVRALS